MWQTMRPDPDDIVERAEERQTESATERDLRRTWETLLTERVDRAKKRVTNPEKREPENQIPAECKTEREYAVDVYVNAQVLDNQVWDV